MRAGRVDKIRSAFPVAKVLAPGPFFPTPSTSSLRFRQVAPRKTKDLATANVLSAAAAKMSSDKPLPFIYQFAAGS